MEKEIVGTLLVLALLITCIEIIPLNAATLADKILGGQLSQFQKFRLLAVEGVASGGHAIMESGQYLIKKLTEFPNWNNNTLFTAYIQLLSWHNETEIIDGCKKFYAGNATKFNVQRLIRDFLGQASTEEFIIFYITTDGGSLELFLDEKITAYELLSWLGPLHGTVCVIFDSCFSGSFISDGQGGILGPGRIVLCSSMSNQSSWGMTEPFLGGDFTGFESIRYPNGTSLPKGLIGSTIAGEDANGDGWLSVMECFTYAQASVQQFYPEDSKYHQDPVAYNGLDFDPQFVQLPLKPPTANFTCAPTTPWVNETTVFNASNSTGTIVSYQWNFGDNNVTTTTLPTINHTYTKVGKYTVTLNVTDNQGLWNTTTVKITVTYRTDLNKDGTVNIIDIATAAKAFGSHGPDIPNPGDPPSKNWNATADMDKNGWINIIDIATVAREYGKTT
jgi:hypothetical protein